MNGGGGFGVGAANDLSPRRGKVFWREVRGVGIGRVEVGGSSREGVMVGRFGTDNHY